MTKIYDALKRAEQEHDQARPLGESGLKAPAETPRQKRALRQKLIAAYQTIDSRLPDKASRVVMFVSSRAGEGCSVLARELAALAAAELGQRAVLIDVTPSAGGHFEHFGVAPADEGIEAVAANRASLSDVLRPVPDNPQLCLAHIAAGEGAASVVAAAKNLGEPLKALREDFKLILLDMPPLAESSDALVMTPLTDGVVLVVEAEKTRWQVAENAREKLAMQGGNLLGVVLNKRRFYIPGFVYRRL